MDPSMAPKGTLASLTGSYNNLNEEIPLVNKPELILGVLIPLQVLAGLCGLLRLWTRFRVIKAPGWDDLFIILSLLTTTISTTVTCLGATTYGLGKHFVLIGGAEARRDYLHGFYVGNGSYVLSTTFIKLALLLQYLRVFERRTFLHRFSIVIAILVSLWGIAFTVIAWFPCSPVQGFWSGDPTANCWGFASQTVTHFRATFMTHAALNTAFDLVTLSIPGLLYFKQGDVQSKMRWGLLGVLLLGTVANLMSIWRLESVLEHHAATSPTFDPTWYGCISIVLGAIEVDIAVICASVPVFWPVFQSTGFQIFITREVQVTSQQLRSIDDESRKGHELEYTASGKTGANILHRQESLNSKTGSEENLHMVANSGYNSSDGGPLGTSDDTYGLGSVDPSGRTRWAQPGTRVKVTANVI